MGISALPGADLRFAGGLSALQGAGRRTINTQKRRNTNVVSPFLAGEYLGGSPW